MAFTINGFGTTYYGQSDFLPDGTFQTTEWLVACWFPIIPLRTYRAARNTKADVNLVLASTTGYYLLAKIPLGYAQIFRTYAFAIGYFGWIGLVGTLLFDELKIHERSALVAAPIAAIVLASLAIPIVVLRRRRTAAFEAARKTASTRGNA